MYSQEQLVDQQISDYLESKYKGFKDRLSKSSPNLKRNGQASLLGANRKVYELIKRLEQLNNKDKYHTYFDELVNAYREYVEVADCEVKTHGEVMTPIWLVEDMLNTLPSDVWSNPNLKWLDPCSGVGTYSSIVVQRLMKGLEDFEANPIKRYRHIIEEMIYVCELQPKNMFIFQCVFDKDDTNELNTYCGSFLDENFDKHMTNVWGVEKFDIVMGNPPYQSSKEGQTKTKAIWHLFVNKSMDILIDGGYLNMVHPSGWRNVDGNFKETQNRMKSKEMLRLKLHSFKQGQEIFGAAINFDYYTIKNVPNKNKTHITCVDGSELHLDISNLDFIPDENIINILDLVAKDGEERVEILFSRGLYGNDKKHMSKTKTDTNVFPCVYSVKSPNKNNEVGLWYSTQNNGHFDVPKVIFASGASGVYVDEKGEYGIMNFACGIVDEVENLKLIQKALLNENFIRNIMGFKASLGDKYNRKVIGTFRKDFYKQFLND